MKAALTQVPKPGLANVASNLGWGLLALSLVILAGWAFHLPLLQSFFPGYNFTKANTAAALLLAALALLRRGHRDLFFYSSGVFLIGALTLTEYFAQISLGIDQLLFRDSNFFFYPGRMSQYTSSGFVLLGPALFFMQSSRLPLRRFSRGLSLVTGAIGAVTLMSMSYESHSAYLIHPQRNVAIPTAIGFMIAAIGVQYANPFEGLIRLVHAPDAGGVMLRRLLPAGLVISLVLGFVVTIAQRQSRWEFGFSLALVAAGITACLVTIIVLTAADLAREDLSRRESEQRFRLVANRAPVMIWMAGTDNLCNYFNDPWLEFTGRALEAELGNGWMEGVHPDDLKRCMATYLESFDRRDSFQMQYRLRRHDGEYRWVFDTGVPRFDEEGFFAGYIGSCIDVTERKVAEEALADLERRVLSAQEEERSRIARELHDDINQRIAILGWELRSLGQASSDGEGEPRISIESVIERLGQIGADIQTISRRLHSSHLEYLGLGTAAEVLCKDLREQQQVEIDFTCEGIPRDLPKDISLCLYRILQEALQNALKHSGARHLRVELVGNAGEVRLTVSDEGVGFDRRRTDRRQGLGLISMRERMRLVHGEFAVESEPGRGTTIRCRVPLGNVTAGEQLVHGRETV
jgi:PAS domain S-box-containing protein